MPRTQHDRTQYIALVCHRCKACWTCVTECPKQVIGRVNFFRHRHAHIDHANACVGCQKCIKACPNQAILERNNINNMDLPDERWSSGSHRHMNHRRVFLQREKNIRKESWYDWANTIMDLLA